MDKPRGGDLRKGRVSESGRAYLVTSVTEGRRPLFLDLYSARILVKEFKRADESGLTKTWAFVVMPDHFHWLFQLGEAELDRVVLRVKSRSAIVLNKAIGGDGQRVWQKGFHDHALRDEEALQDVARYVVTNPVRAGFANSVRDYPHWDAAWL